MNRTILMFPAILLIASCTPPKPEQPQVDPLAHGPGYAPAYPPYERNYPLPPIQEANPPIQEANPSLLEDPPLVAD